MIASTDLEALQIPWCFREDANILAETHKAFVINLDDKGSKGTHWTSARLVNNILYYADPFGTILNGYPPESLSHYKCVANGISFQRPSTHLCGYYAICFVDALNSIDELIGKKEFEQRLYHSII